MRAEVLIQARIWGVSVVALLACVLHLPSAAHAQRNTAVFTSSGRVSLLPTCQKVLASLSEEQIEQLRDAVQQLNVAFSVKHGLPTPPPTWPPSSANASSAGGAQRLLRRRLHQDVVSAGKTVAEMVQQLRDAGSAAKDTTDAQLQACVSGRLRAHATPGRPRVSFMLQYFHGHGVALPAFLDHLALCQEHFPTELIVNVDHPADHALWVAAAHETGGLVVPVLSRNVHEIRAYNRMLSVSRGQYIIFLQDDSPPKRNCSWLPPLLRAFERWPDVGVFGLRSYQFCCCSQTHNQNEKRWFEDPNTGEAMFFAQRVDMAPVSFRREALESIGGLDETLSDPGMCGISSDWHYSHTLWLGGWQVAYWSHLYMGSSGVTGGTHRGGGATQRCWTRQMTIVAQTMGAKMERRVEDEMCGTARLLNLRHLHMVDPGSCPYKHSNCTLQERQ